MEFVKMDFYSKLTEETRAWEIENFGAQHPWTSVMGLIEELGELHEAIDKGYRNNIQDSLGDIVIYLANLCWKLDYDLDEIMAKGLLQYTAGIGVFSITQDIPRRQRWLAHTFLKMQQGIRFTNGKARLEEELVSIALLLHIVSEMMNRSLEIQVGTTWRKVQQRNWKKDKLNAGEVQKDPSS